MDSEVFADVWGTTVAAELALLMEDARQLVEAAHREAEGNKLESLPDRRMCVYRRKNVSAAVIGIVVGDKVAVCIVDGDEMWPTYGLEDARWQLVQAWAKERSVQVEERDDGGAETDADGT